MEEFRPYNAKRMNSSINSELVTCRTNIKNDKTAIRISIGTTICSLLDFKRGTKVNPYLHKCDRNIMIIAKTEELGHGYTLSQSLHSNFLTFDFRMSFEDGFKLKQTIPVDHEFDDRKILLIDLTKAKWSM